MSINKLTELMMENNKNTKMLIENKLENKDNTKETDPSEQFKEISKSAAASKRINGFSRDLSKELDNIGMKVKYKEDDTRNKDFLKVMSQNITNAEIKIAENDRQIRDSREREREQEKK